jgi:tRNA A37 N6-isopentenylltransferase MiaA
MQKPLVAVVGATGTGKSKVIISLVLLLGFLRAADRHR